jgi:DNA-binding transcriptional MerR regulator
LTTTLERMSNRPSWTLSEAAERTGASRSTIRRYRETGKFPHAYKGTDKQWRVPVEDLLASGLTLNGQAQVEQVNTLSEQPTEQVPEPLSERVRELEALLAVERARAAGLERVAAAAEANAADLRMALRMIEATRPDQPEQAHPKRVSLPTEQPSIPVPEQGEQPEQAHPEATPGQAAPRSGWRRLLWGPN